ncbi:MAG TPA: DUF6229 family protein [Trebonia sp.]|nr:DUF6229 family protein [Trebonia sp.]
MTHMEMKAAEQAAEQWRIVAGPDNPAGPLYVSGAFAEPDIMEAAASYTHMCSPCTASGHIQCC